MTFIIPNNQNGYSYCEARHVFTLPRSESEYKTLHITLWNFFHRALSLTYFVHSSIYDLERNYGRSGREDVIYVIKPPEYPHPPILAAILRKSILFPGFPFLKA